MTGYDQTNESEVVQWLLQPENPPVRYLAMRHLLGHRESDPEVQVARAAIATSVCASRIFARQAPEGYWGDVDNPYLPKYKSTYWTLMLLGHLHLSRADERVRKAAEYAFGFQQADGGFAEYGAEAARREYLLLAERRRAQGKSPPPEQDWMGDHVRQMTHSCLTGNTVAALFRLGYQDDPRVWHALDWLVSIQRSDGGWQCPYWKAHIRDQHSCFYGSICALEALSEAKQSPQARSPEIGRTPAAGAIARGAEFLLMHRLYRSNHHDWAIINPHWLTLSFPWFYGYNILRGLWVLARLGVRDDRMNDALAVLAEKRSGDGKWILESAPQGRMQVNLEKSGQPSKWVTLHALWALSESTSSGCADPGTRR